jgi:hypothetical protein
MAQTEPVAAPAVTEDFDISARADVAKLRKGAVGLGGVLFLTLTAQESRSYGQVQGRRGQRSST